MSKCPACTKEIEAKNTTVGDVGLLCKEHKDDLNKWLNNLLDMDGVDDRRDDSGKYESEVD